MLTHLEILRDVARGRENIQRVAEVVKATIKHVVHICSSPDPRFHGGVVHAPGLLGHHIVVALHRGIPKCLSDVSASERCPSEAPYPVYL